EARDPRRVRRTVERELQECLSSSRGQQVHRYPAHDLVCPEVDSGHAEYERCDSSPCHAGDRASGGAPGVVRAQHGAKGSREHEAFQRERNDPRALAEHATGRRKEEGRCETKCLQDEGEDDHAAFPVLSIGARPRAERSVDRTAGVDATTARITTAWSMPTNSRGTTAFTAKPPCERVAKKSAAST